MKSKNHKFKGYRTRFQRHSKGFSITELLVVVAMIAILAAISIPMIVSSRKLYRSEEQALKVIDLMGEASQKALNQRRIYRFEIDLTDNVILLIDENGANPDVLVKRIPMNLVSEVRMDQKPDAVNKPNPPNFNDAVFAADSLGHMDGSTSVTGHQVFAARFRSDGSVVNAAGVPLTANIYVWAPKVPASTIRRSNGETKALTLYGASGLVRYWKYDGTQFIEGH